MMILLEQFAPNEGNFASQPRVAVIAIDYGLAPECPFPAGLIDCVAAWRALACRPAAFGVRPGPLLVAGDSAGANLGLGSAQDMD